MSIGPPRAVKLPYHDHGLDDDDDDHLSHQLRAAADPRAPTAPRHHRRRRTRGLRNGTGHAPRWLRSAHLRPRTPVSAAGRLAWPGGECAAAAGQVGQWFSLTNEFLRRLGVRMGKARRRNQVLVLLVSGYGLLTTTARGICRWVPALRERLVGIGNKSPLMQIRRWQDGKVLVQQELMDMAGFIGHRGDYHEEFLRAVREKGVEITMGKTVVEYDEFRPAVKMESGETFEADVIVAADGIKSLARELVLGFDDQPKSSGYACFRAFFKGSHLKEDPMCREFVSKECVNVWIGNDVHLVQNTLRDGEEFNWILTHKDTADIKESWFQPGDMDEVRKIMQTCDPRIAAAVNKTKECLDWKICYRDPIPTWVSKSHKVVLLGDSCHPHLPTSAQGASQAIESAAVLAECLKLAGPGDVPLAVGRKISMLGNGNSGR
ncbi:hypothetical protein MMC17_002930 [Xylographa soralifera]|nr:hypothetical protein [Xylographa soralifera]